MNRPIVVVLLIILLCGLLLAGTVLAMGSANFAIDWDVIGGGGGRSTSANFALNGTVGQAVTGYTSSANFALCSGYWCGGGGYRIFLPLVVRNHS